ncbi:MAG: UDP-N-acetylmuramoyl-L-alanyl-D-glutamate--2,6-diaminopimelate ligase [Thermoleophilia bacterium]
MSASNYIHLDDFFRCFRGEIIRRDTVDSGNKITGLAYDSRAVKPGYLFAAVPGFKVDGHDFIPQARKAGAILLLSERWVENTGMIQVQVPSVRKAMAYAAQAFYGNTQNQPLLIGITGTNGKTTTTYLIDSILRESGLDTGLVGGIEYRMGENSAAATRTTPEAFNLHRLLKATSHTRIDTVTMEVSSHGIDLYRVACLDFAVAVFTNLTRDHLDLHGSMEHYYQVKRSLFAGSLEQPGNPDVPIAANRPLAAVNIDDSYGRRLAAELEDRLVTYGMSSEADVRAVNIEYEGWKTGFTLITPAGSVPVQLHLAGAFNLANALAAAAAGIAAGISPNVIAAGLSASNGAPGRFEQVAVDAPFRVIVDYAHNEDGLAKALTAARSLSSGRLILVFGCPGERDREKRPAMGKVAGSLADLAILTTDDCYSEPPEQILDETESGLIESGGEYQRVSDRRQAIEAAVAAAGPGDTVLLAGKGHETRQIMADGPLSFSDTNVIKEILTSKL